MKIHKIILELFGRKKFLKINLVEQHLHHQVNIQDYTIQEVHMIMNLVSNIITALSLKKCMI